VWRTIKLDISKQNTPMGLSECLVMHNTRERLARSCARYIECGFPTIKGTKCDFTKILRYIQIMPTIHWAFLVSAGVLAASIAAVSPVLAQEPPDSRPDGLFREVIGPYEIGVLSLPSGLSLGQVTFIVFVVETPSGKPIADANVVIRVSHGVSGTNGFGLAVHTSDIPEQYNATMNMDNPGTWTAMVEVSSTLGKVEVEIPPVIVPAQRQRIAGSIVFLGMSGVILLGAAYVIWTMRRALKKRSTIDAN